jgi:hypothetical protein
MRVPAGFTACNIGQSPQGGEVTVDSSTNEITIRSAAGNIGGGNDQFFFLFRTVEGNATITTTAPARPTASTDQARAGLMLRESLDEGARFVSLVLTPSNGLLLEARMTAGDANLVSTRVIEDAALQAPIQLRLVRNQDTITAQVSKDNGQTFENVGNPIGFTQALPQTMYAGLAVTGRDDSRTTQARAGLMLRESLDEGARFVSLVLTPSNGLLLEARMNAGDASLVSTRVLEDAALQTPIQLRLVRNQNTITAQVSKNNGQSFENVGNPIAFTQALPQTMYAGLAVTGRDDSRTTQARFANFVVANP